MAENSNIEWTDHTFNPWIGCTKVSDGCKHCYAQTLMDNLSAYEALRGSLTGIPFILSRIPREISTPGKDGKQKAAETE